MDVIKNFETGGKKILFRIFRLFIRKENIEKENIHSADIRNILIIRLDRKIGNLVLSLPLVSGVKKTFSQANISVLVCKENESILGNNPYIDEIFVFYHKRYFRNPFSLLVLIGRLRKRKFDLVIDSSNPGSASITSCLLAYFSKADVRIGFNNKYSGIFLNILVKPRYEKHYIDMQLDLIRVFNKNIRREKGNLFLSEEEKEDAETFFKSCRNKKLICIWIGGAEEKRWGIENFLKLKEKLEEDTENEIFFFCGIHEKELAYKVRSGNTAPEIYEFSEVRKLAAFINAIDVFVCGIPVRYIFLISLILLLSVSFFMKTIVTTDTLKTINILPCSLMKI